MQWDEARKSLLQRLNLNNKRRLVSAIILVRTKTEAPGEAQGPGFEEGETSLSHALLGETFFDAESFDGVFLQLRFPFA